MAERIVSAKPHTQDGSLDLSLRPKTLSEYIGQDKVKGNLSISVAASKKRGEALDHILLYGPPGLGKTTLANIIAAEMGVSIKTTSGPAVERAGDLAAIITNLKKDDILFIDEVHRLSRAVEEVLYPAMEDFALDIMIGKGAGARSLRLKLPRFTFVGATTRYAMVSAPLRNRFGAVYRLDFYDTAAIKEIVSRAASILGVKAEDAGLEEIARRARGTPRVANRLLKRVRDYAEVMADGVISKQTASEALTRLEVDSLGPGRNRPPRPTHHHPELQRRSRGSRHRCRIHQRGTRHYPRRIRTLPSTARLPGPYASGEGCHQRRIRAPGHRLRQQRLL